MSLTILYNEIISLQLKDKEVKTTLSAVVALP